MDEKDKIVGEIKNEIANQVRSTVGEAVKAEMAEIEKRSAPRILSLEEEKRTVYNKVGEALRDSKVGDQISLRAITANSASVSVVNDVVTALVDGGRITSRITTYTGSGINATVPVFAPHLAVPVGTTEGATGTSSDSTAVLAGKQLVLKPWYSTLPISRGALLGAFNIEAKLPELFRTAFNQAFDKAILMGAGTGNDALGVFTVSASGVPSGQNIVAGQATSVKWADLAKLAVTILGTFNMPDDGKAAIVVSPTVMNSVLADATAGTDPYRYAYLANQTILGVPIIMSSYAPATLTTGLTVAIGGYFGHYAMAFADDLIIEPVRTVGSDNITYQSFVYMMGTPLVGTSFNRLILA